MESKYRGVDRNHQGARCVPERAHVLRSLTTYGMTRGAKDVFGFHQGDHLANFDDLFDGLYNVIPVFVLIVASARLSCFQYPLLILRVFQQKCCSRS